MKPEPQYKPNRKITHHRDGTVSYFDGSQWRRTPAENITDHDLANMPRADRERVIRTAERAIWTEEKA